MIEEELNIFQIHAIAYQVRELAKEKDGLDYLQVFKDENGRKLFFIDNLNDDMVTSRNFDPDCSYCTLMFATEY